jgi:hypothetical protein
MGDHDSYSDKFKVQRGRERRDSLNFEPGTLNFMNKSKTLRIGSG